MELVNQLRLAAKKEIAAFGKFLNEYKPNSKHIYCFYEGKDDKLYYNRIVQTVSKLVVKDYACDSKGGVLKVYELIKREGLYKTAKIGFFIDADFDPPLNNNDIYETPYYSIENFYVEAEVLEKMLVSFFEFERDGEDILRLIELYKDLQNQFHEKTLSINAYLSCHADYRNLTKSKRLNIKSKVKFPNDIINEGLNSVQFESKTFDEIEQAFKQQGIIERTSFTERENQLKGANMCLRFRGKFEIKFTTDFIKKLIEGLKYDKFNFLDKTYKVHYTIHEKNILGLLSQFTEIPNSLQDYIKAVAA